MTGFYFERSAAEVRACALLALCSGLWRRCDRRAPDTMMRVAALLLGLVLCLRAEFAPPTLNISLDEDPAVRWAPLAKAFDVEYLKKAAAEVIE